MSEINWVDRLKFTPEQVEDLRNAGYAYIKQGKYDIALQFFNALHILDRNNLYDIETLGALYLETGNPMRAIRLFDQALTLEGNHVNTLLNLSKAFLILGKKEEGLKIARMLTSEKDPRISSIAEALLLAYS